MLVYMSHIGSFIPCDRARVSITDQILARMSSVETCAVPQSSFQLDLTQMATILRRSTPNTLVLIDEFGKVCYLKHANCIFIGFADVLTRVDDTYRELPQYRVLLF